MAHLEAPPPTLTVRAGSRSPLPILAFAERSVVADTGRWSLGSLASRGTMQPAAVLLKVGQPLTSHPRLADSPWEP